MTWRTHAAGGVASLWLLAPLPGVLTPASAGLMAATAALGALLPDLDAQDSKARRLALGGVRPLEPLGGLLHGLFGHRGLLHSLPGWLGFGALCLALSPWTPWEAPLGLFAGYGSHLALDACTVRGVPLLPARRGGGRWGLGRSRHLLPRRLRVATGTPAEDPAFFLLACAALALLLHILLLRALAGPPDRPVRANILANTFEPRQPYTFSITNRHATTIVPTAMPRPSSQTPPRPHVPGADRKRRPPRDHGDDPVAAGRVARVRRRHRLLEEALRRERWPDRGWSDGE